MSRDGLEVALSLPEISAHSGGVERCLRLIEHSRSVGIAYTVFLPRGGVPDRGVAARLEELARAGHAVLKTASGSDGSTGRTFDAVVVPSEFWTGPLSQARAAGLCGPALVEFMQLPYVGTLDVLKTRGIDAPRALDLLRLPLISSRVLGDRLSLSLFQSAACAISVRSLARLGPRSVLGLTAVVTKNLQALGFPHAPFVPECPVGVDATAVRRVREEGHEPEYDGVYVGRFHPHKGFLDLPRVAATLRERAGRDVRIAVCGTPQFPRHVAAFRHLVEALGVGRNLTMLGWQTREDLYRTVARSRLLLYPSYVDSFSITVLESLCLGTPVAAYAIDAMQLVWGRRDGVFLTPVGDPAGLAGTAAGALEATAGEDYRRRMAGQSNRLLEAYTWDNAAAAEREFYDRALAGPETA